MAALPNHELGHALGKAGARVTLGAYVDYVCPFSKKQITTLRSQVLPHYLQNKDFRFVFYHQVQPWHPQSTIAHEAGLAVAKVGGEDAFWKFTDAFYENQTRFFDVNVYDKTRPVIASEMADLAADSAGVSRDAIKDLLSLAKIEGVLNPASNIAKELKWEVRHARQHGIHGTPTNTINDIVFNSSSSWGLEEWKKVLDPLLE